MNNSYKKYITRKRSPDFNKSALIIIDMQEYFSYIASSVIKNINSLIKKFREKDALIIFTQHGHLNPIEDAGMLYEWWGENIIEGTAEHKLMAGLLIYDNDIVIKKRRYSAFRGTDFELVLRSLGKDTLIITGTTTSTGIESTARDALDMDIKVIFPSDGTYSGDIPDMGWGPVSGEEIMRVVLTVMQYRFARVLTVDELIAELK